MKNRRPLGTDAELIWEPNKTRVRKEKNAERLKVSESVFSKMTISITALKSTKRHERSVKGP
jgi:hypothetical protein